MMLSGLTCSSEADQYEYEYYPKHVARIEGAASGRRQGNGEIRGRQISCSLHCTWLQVGRRAGGRSAKPNPVIWASSVHQPYQLDLRTPEKHEGNDIVT